MKFAIWAIAALALRAIAFAGDRPNVVQLRQDLVGKSFSLRVQVAGSTCIQQQGLSFGETTLVDTEVDGQNIRYYARANRLLRLRECSPPVAYLPSGTLVGMYIDAGRVEMHPEASIMLVKQVDAKPDRLEILLTANGQSGDQAYGKIKLMLGQGYESRSLEELEVSLNRVIELPRIKGLLTARNLNDTLENEITALNTSLSTTLTPQQKALNAVKLLTLYDQEPGAATQLNRFAFSPVPIPETSAKIENTKRALAGFQQQADKEKIDVALTQYATATSQMAADCKRLSDTDVKTREELEVQISAVGTSRQDLSKFESARREMLNLGQSAPQSDEDYSARCSVSCDHLSQTFSKKEQTVSAKEAIAAEAGRQRQEKEAQLEQGRLRAQQLDSSDESFRRLKQQKVALEAKLVTVLGGPDEFATYSVYRDLIEEMIQNRQQAQALGSRSAEREMEALNSQLQKLGQ
jgi:hypothetical protein